MNPERQQQLNWYYEQVFVAANEVHLALGRNLPEETYRECLAHELELMGRKVQRDVAVPILFRDHTVEKGIEIALVVDGLVAVAVWSAEKLTQFHDQGMQAVLRISGLPLGIVINFSVPSVRGATHRILNPQPRV